MLLRVVDTNDLKIAIIGTGNVASNLAFAMFNKGIHIAEVIGRNANNAAQLAQQINSVSKNNIAALGDDINLIILAVNDDSISDVVGEIANRTAVIVHTSGSKEMSIFRQNGFDKFGVFYPLQSLSKSTPIDFDKVPLCLEAVDNHTLNILELLANSISNFVYHIDSEKRKTLHLAAVFANNFSNHMFSISESILRKHNLPFEILKPLIEHTATKIKTNSPQSQQTGPALRGDVETQNKHLSLLNDEELQIIYKQISNHIASKKVAN